MKEHGISGLSSSLVCFVIDPHIISDCPCSPTVYWIAKLNLTPDDRGILQEGGQLNDKIIAGVGMILESQFQLTLYTQAIENLDPAEEGSLPQLFQPLDRITSCAAKGSPVR